MLPKVSRTFALGIRMLPVSLATPVEIAYLLCRIADTVEDNVEMPVEERQALLAVLGSALGNPALGIGDILSADWGDEERELMASADRPLREFRRLPVADQAAVIPWVREMVHGMATQLGHGRGRLEPVFETMADLRYYCYVVAGTVGHLLTDLFQIHCRGIDAELHKFMSSLATSFGLGLQLTNVIRDIPDDRGAGRNLVPSEVWSRVGLHPERLFAAGSERESWQVIELLVQEAKEHLSDALAYCTALPRSAIRVRFFCLSSLLFACRTLALIEIRKKEVTEGVKVKMPRYEVYTITFATLLFAPFNGVMKLLFGFLAPRFATQEERVR